MWLENPAQVGLIKPFEVIDLPPLAVIIGLNGAGKTQLLKAIADGKLRASFSPDFSNQLIDAAREITLLTNIDPDPDGLTIPRQTDLQTILRTPVRVTEAAHAVDELMAVQRAELATVEAAAHAGTQKTANQFGPAWTAFLRGQVAISSELERVPNLRQVARQGGDRLRQLVLKERAARAPNQPMHSMTPMHEAVPERWLGFSRAELASAMGFEETALFAPPLATIFLEYRNRRWRNQVQHVTDAQDGTSIARSPEEFEVAYGRPPWDRVSAALQSFGLPYRVAVPSSNPDHPVSFTLIRDGASEPLEYGSLSTGERVLLRMVLAIFQADDDRYMVHTPKLVLLDELDASLHPDNVRRWLSAIQKGYVEALGISCILTTHSPTTVALAPEGAIFEMSAEDTRPQAISKQHAIDRLTAGLPMLAIDYSSRRQVFTESTIDVDHYSRLHDLMRAKLDMGRSLSFVGTGTKGGCDFVYKMVDHMEQNGNQAVFGIVDWDLTNPPTKRVKVIADGSHYAKDNLLLDPLLVGALLLKGDELPLDPPVQYGHLRDAPPEVLQRVSDAVVDKLSFPHAAGKAMAENRYWGGAVIVVREAYQKYNGHEVEKLIKKAFPMLDSRYKAEGELITTIIRRVLLDYPEFCPQPVADLFVQLANDQP